MSFIDVPASLQIELSNVCNALCPTCQRNTLDWQILKDMKDSNTKLTLENLPVINVPEVANAPNIYVDVDTIKNITQSKLFNDISRVEFVGTIDDPLASPYLLDILETLHSAKPSLKFSLHTNGSLRTTNYFTELAKHFINPGNSVSFSIDGLDDTNHLYRKNCQWHKIIENAQAFIKAGGNATWQYIEFPWNSHQVTQAKQLSEELGFKKFKHRNNIHNQWEDFDNWQWEDFVDLMDADPLYSISKINPTDTVTCNYQKRKQYHISHDSKLWPCCILNSARGNVKISRHFADNWNNRYIDNDWNSLKKHSIDDIVQHEFYKTDLTDSWNSNTHGPNKKDRIINCTMSCSKANTNAIQSRVKERIHNV